MISLTKDMEVGIFKIDSQHRELIERLNAVTAMGAKSVSKEETDKTFSLLSQYVAKHFGDEENIMKQYGFPKIDWHKQQHKLYVQNIYNLKMEFDRNGPSAKFTLDLNNSIVSWIVRHIKSADVELGKYLKSQKGFLGKSA